MHPAAMLGIHMDTIQLSPYMRPKLELLSCATLTHINIKDNKL